MKNVATEECEESEKGVPVFLPGICTSWSAQLLGSANSKYSAMDMKCQQPQSSQHRYNYKVESRPLHSPPTEKVRSVQCPPIFEEFVQCRPISVLLHSGGYRVLV